jgi:tetratricopeptide (TPR) repeat protein
MDYLEYAYLQSGRVLRAKSVVDELNSLKPIPGLTMTGGYANAAIPARFALERSDWETVSLLRPASDSVPWAQAITWMGIGIGSARSGKLDRALQAEHTLATLRDSASVLNMYWSNQIEVQRREVAAWIAENNGKNSDGIATMRSAAELEESMDKHAVTPGAIIPAREMLAELLSLHHRAEEALVEYQAVLKNAPNRFNALYGAARAAENSGNATVADQYFRKLTAIAVGDERAELIEAHKRIAVLEESQHNDAALKSSH